MMIRNEKFIPCAPENVTFPDVTHLKTGYTNVCANIELCFLHCLTGKLPKYLRLRLFPTISSKNREDCF